MAVSHNWTPPPDGAPRLIQVVPSIGGTPPPESDAAREARLRAERKVVALNVLCARIAHEGWGLLAKDTVESAFDVANIFLEVGEERKDKPVAGAGKDEQGAGDS